MFIYEFLSEGLGQFSFQATPPVLRPGGRVNVPPVQTRFATFAPLRPIPSPITEWQVRCYTKIRGIWRICSGAPLTFRDVNSASTVYFRNCAAPPDRSIYEKSYYLIKLLEKRPNYRGEPFGWVTIQACILDGGRTRNILPSEATALIAD
jgi:hypothetical protein